MKNILLLLFTLAVTIPTFAQQSYNVSGTVSDGDGQILSGATISLRTKLPRSHPRTRRLCWSRAGPV